MQFKLNVLLLVFPFLVVGLVTTDQQVNSKCGDGDEKSANTDDYQYVIVIDAGSTHSGAMLFRWNQVRNGTGLVEPVGKECNREPGISFYIGDNEKDAVKHLKECIDQVAQGRKNVPIYISATAGIRVTQILNPDGVESLFSTIQKQLEDDCYNIKHLGIISGRDEGVYAWIAVNYLHGTIVPNDIQQQDSDYTYGVLEMGGSSTQIAHEDGDEAIPPDSRAYKKKRSNKKSRNSKKLHKKDYKRELEDELLRAQEETPDVQSLTLFGRKYEVCSFTNLCYGARMAYYRHLRLVMDLNEGEEEAFAHCLPKSSRVNSANLSQFDNGCTRLRNQPNKPLTQVMTFKGTGEYDLCEFEVKQLIDTKMCEQNFDSQFCVKKSAQNRSPNRIFHAISTYDFATNVLELKDGKGAKEMKKYLEKTKKLCGLTVKEIKKEFPKAKEPYIDSACFTLIYIYKILTEVHQFTSKTWKNIRFTGKFKDKPILWTLGYAIQISAEMTNSRSGDHLGSGGMLSILSCVITVLIILAVMSVIVFFLSRQPIQHDHHHEKHHPGQSLRSTKKSQSQSSKHSASSKKSKSNKSNSTKSKSIKSHKTQKPKSPSASHRAKFVNHL